MTISFDRDFFYPIGTSQSPLSFDSTNIESRGELLIKELGVRTLGIVSQTHSDSICDINYSELRPLSRKPIINFGAADCILLSEIPPTSKSDLSFAFGIRTADCLPIIIQSENKAAIIHAGWRGLAQNLIEKTLVKMVDDSKKPNRLQVWIGPAAKKCCYQIGPEVLMALNLPRPEAGPPFYIDLQELAESRIRSLIELVLIKVDRRCTICGPLLHSHRANGTKSRNLSFFVV